MNDPTIRRILDSFRRLPPPTPGFSASDLVSVQPMTLPVSELDLEYVEGPISEVQEECNICTLGR